MADSFDTSKDPIVLTKAGDTLYAYRRKDKKLIIMPWLLTDRTELVGPVSVLSADSAAVTTRVRIDSIDTDLERFPSDGPSPIGAYRVASEWTKESERVG